MADDESRSHLAFGNPGGVPQQTGDPGIMGETMARVTCFGMSLLLVLAGCKGEPIGPSGPLSTNRFFTEVYAVLPSGAMVPAQRVNKLTATAPITPVDSQLTTAAGVLVNEVLTATPGAITSDLALQSSVITGTPVRLRVVGAAPFTRVALSVLGAEDYWEVVLPSPMSEVQLIATATASMPNMTFSIISAVGDENGYGALSQQTTTAIDLAHTDVAMVLRWNSLSDVDIHVIDPNGDEVYFGSTRVGNGSLDLDSNPACDFDGVNQEVISWPADKALVGEYRVLVYYWSDCGQPKTDYSVNIMMHGASVEVVNGTFTGLGSPSTSQEVGSYFFP